MKLKTAPILLFLAGSIFISLSTQASKPTIKLYDPIPKVDLKGKELGINFRNLWFGSSADILYRKPSGENKYKRHVVSIAGNYVESENPSTSFQGVPQKYRSNTDGFISFGFETGREKRHELIEDFYVYHGPTLTFSVGQTSRKTTSGTSEIVFLSKETNTTVGLGAGYLGGVGFSFTERFAIQLDNLIQIRANARLNNRTQSSFDRFTGEEDSEVIALDQLYTSITIPSLNQIRIWLIFKF
ncbi:hypothetical protein GYB29_05410 [bacterium]|nr:hypothetical protein [bacterium]